jgi:hypothetical protein
LIARSPIGEDEIVKKERKTEIDTNTGILLENGTRRGSAAIVPTTADETNATGLKAGGSVLTETTSIVAAKTKSEAGDMIGNPKTCAPVVASVTETGTEATILIAAKIVSDMDIVIGIQTGGDEPLKKFDTTMSSRQRTTNAQQSDNFKLGCELLCDSAELIRITRV